jgi:hypothetical protein
MSTADWGLLIPVIVTLAGAIAAWLNSQAAKSSAISAHARIDALPQSAPKPAPNYAPLDPSPGTGP